MIFALLLDPGESIRLAQLAWLDNYALPAVARETRLLIADAQRLAPEARLPLVEMAAPALCQMTPAQFHDFVRCVEAMVQADHKLTLFEFTLQRLLIRHVVTHFVRAQPPKVKYTTIPPLCLPVAVVLSALAEAGEQTPEGAARAFAEGVRVLGWPGVNLVQAPAGSVGIAEIDAAVELLALASPRASRSRSWKLVRPASALTAR